MTSVLESPRRSSMLGNACSSTDCQDAIAARRNDIRPWSEPARAAKMPECRGAKIPEHARATNNYAREQHQFCFFSFTKTHISSTHVPPENSRFSVAAATAIVMTQAGGPRVLCSVTSLGMGEDARKRGNLGGTKPNS